MLIRLHMRRPRGIVQFHDAIVAAAADPGVDVCPTRKKAVTGKLMPGG